MKPLAFALLAPLAACAAPAPAPTPEFTPPMARLSDRALAGIDAVTGAPETVGRRIARAVALRLGPPAAIAERDAAPRWFALRGAVSEGAAALARDPDAGPVTLAVDWQVRDERDDWIGAFRSAAPLAPGGRGLSGWARLDRQALARLAAGAADRFRRLPPVVAAIEGKPGF